jgi:hypothetical protein
MLSYRELRDQLNKFSEEHLDRIVLILHGPSGRLYEGDRLEEYEEGEDGPPGIPVIVAEGAGMSVDE